MDLWEKFGMSEGLAELWQELGVSAGTCNLCMSGLQDTSQGLYYAAGTMVHRYFVLWHIYDYPFDNSYYHKADSL